MLAARTLAGALVVLIAATIVDPPAWAHGFRKGEIGVRHPWTRATPPGATVAAGYLEIRNFARNPDRLVDASSPLAERVELHVLIRDGSIEAKRLDIPARERPFATGERIPLALQFEKSGALEVQFEVQPPGSVKPHH